MITDSLYFQCALFTAKFCVTCLLYKIYKTNAECLKSLKEAPCFEIDSKLQKEVEKCNGIIKYAVISGSTKALSPPLRSQHIPYCEGVIHEKVIKEYKVKWIPYLGNWDCASDISHIKNYVPFALCGKPGGLFRKEMCVKVLEPLIARELILPEVYDVYRYDTIDAVGSFYGEKTKALQEVEKMLCENVTLTAVGKLIIENNELKIKQPDNFFKYFLTPLTIKSLIEKIHGDMRKSKLAFIIMGTLTFTLFIYILRHVFLKVKRKRIRAQRKEQLNEQRKLRRRADRSRRLQNTNMPKCVICLAYPVEVLILKCRHACLCFNCTEQSKSCPVCRNPIVGTVPAFWP